MGKPSAPFDEAGTGNGLTAGLVRHSHRKRGVTDRPSLRSTAPVLDPTCGVATRAGAAFDGWATTQGHPALLRCNGHRRRSLF